MTDQSGPAATEEDAPASTRPWWQHWRIWVGAAGVVLIAVGVIMLAVQDDDGDEAAPSTTSSTTTSTTTTTTSTTTTTTPPPPALTLESLSSDIGSVLPANYSTTAWVCRAEPTLFQSEEPPVTTGPLTAGSIASCEPTVLPAEGQYPVLTVLVLDDEGKYVVSRGGLAHQLLEPVINDEGGLVNFVFVSAEEGTARTDIPPGQNCTDLLAPGSAFDQVVQADTALTPVQEYFGVVMYYFIQDQSPLLDIDNNGIPCETLIPADVVDTVWAGGWIPSGFD